MKTAFTLAEIAKALGITKRSVERRAAHGRWSYSECRVSGGRQRLYKLVDLPPDVQAKIVLAQPPDAPLDDEPAESPLFEYDAEALWAFAHNRSARLREEGERKAALLRQVKRLMATGKNFTAAATLIAAANAVSIANLGNWYYGVNGRVGARQYAQPDWAAALIPGYAGQATRANIHPNAWDWFSAHWLTRKQPSIIGTYRRLLTVAKVKDWLPLPSARTFARRIIADIPHAHRVYYREGEAALAQLYPAQKRDKTCFTAGQAVTGDGLKFDKLYVQWPDGEILNTSTGWFWADLYSGKLLAYRLAKTENTDMFRLATYDLTAVCRPDYCWIDNTVVAANKAMTGGAANRYRFGDQPDDPIGLLLQIGMEVHFTNPDKVLGNPGAKPIERAFGQGGIHEMVASSPRLKDQGYSTATAISYDLFAQIVAEEVTRFNAQVNRRSDVCRGVLSFDQAFEQSFKQATVTKLADSQRRLLLLMPEVVRATTDRGEIRLKAGASKIGQHRYWTEFLVEFKSQQLVAYYDPEQLDQAINVYTLAGKFIGNADHLAGVAFNDTRAAREWAKNKARSTKASKHAALAQQRMNALEVAALYPAPEVAPEIPPPGIVRGNFEQKKLAVNDASRELDAQREADFGAHVAAQVKILREETLEDPL